MDANRNGNTSAVCARMRASGRISALPVNPQTATADMRVWVSRGQPSMGFEGSALKALNNAF
jgi:hypothetical protein